LESRGYRYSTDPDSLDFIVSVKLTNDVRSDEYTHVSYIVPSLDKLAPYLPEDEDSVRENSTLRKVTPRIELFVYDARSQQCAGQFVGATIDTDVSDLVAAEKLLPVLVQWRL